MNFEPTDANMRAAQQALRGMTPEQLAAQFRNMTPEQKLQAQRMGMDPATIEMLASNPDTLKQATDQINNMTPEQLRAYHAMVCVCVLCMVLCPRTDRRDGREEGGGGGGGGGCLVVWLVG